MQKNYFCEKKGFTLIEILVVILIIGVLATIAFPKYEKSVWRSRSIELLQHARALKRAQELYILANGKNPINISDMDLSWPGFTSTCSSDFSSYGLNSSTKKACITNGEFVLFFRPGSGHIFALFAKGKYKYTGFNIHFPDETYCYELSNRNFCKKVLGCTFKSGTSNRYFTCPGI